MQFDSAHGWYNSLLSNTPIQAYFVGKEGSIARTLSIPDLKYKRLVVMEQVHGSSVVVLDSADSIGSLSRRSDDGAYGRSYAFVAGADGVLTNQKEAVLVTRVADCLPILLYHPDGWVGVVHAGRKGTQAEILIKALAQLRNLGLDLSMLKLWFGPAICQKCYQIDREKEVHFDLIEANLKQLSDEIGAEGIGADNINLEHVCTKESTEDFFSYRNGDGKKRNYLVASSSS